MTEQILRSATQPALIRDVHIAEQIVFVDGVSGSGKSILGPILASMDHVEKYRLESIYEYLSHLHAFGKIDTDAAVTLMRIYADEALYKLAISREVNFRPKDHTGFLNSPRKWLYIKRLFQKDGQAAIDRIRKSKPILQTNTHQMFPAIDLAFEAFGERLAVFEMVRHPLFLIPHWVNFVEHYGSDPRDLTLWIKNQDNHVVPWFTHGWDAQFVKLTPMGKSIRAISYLLNGIENAYNRLSAAQREQVLFIPFEKFVTEPWSYLREIEKRLGTQVTSATKKTLKRQRCPRGVITDGRGHAHHAWKRPEIDATNQSEYGKIMDLVNRQASSEEKAILESLIARYEKKFDFNINAL